jgi:hypothetical protein
MSEPLNRVGLPAQSRYFVTDEDVNEMTWGVALGMAVVAVCGVISLWLILDFFWKVYARGGESALSTAAHAVCKVYDPRWLDKVTGFLPGRQSEDEKNDEELEGVGQQGGDLRPG